MNNDHYPTRRNVPGRAGLAALSLLGVGALFAADATGLDPAAPDAPPALVSRAAPKSPPVHQPLIGAQLSFEFVVDAQGQPQDVKLTEAKATLAETGKVIQEADLPALRKAGLLDGVPANASFPEIRDLLTKPFIEPGRDAVLRWRYRPGRKAGVAVATRVTDSVAFQADELLAPGNLAPGQQARPPQTTGRVQPDNPSAATEPVRPAQPFTPPPAPGPSRAVTAVTAVVATSGNAGTLNTPGQTPTTVVRTAGRDSIINTPGEPPSTVMRTPDGGSTIYTPGQAPTTVTPIAGGGSIINAPGQPPSTVVPTAGGGSTIYTPGQAPTMVVPIAGGGSIIYAPGQPPVTVMPTP